MYIIKLCTLIPIMFRAIHQSRYWSNYCIVAWELWVPCFMEALHSISWIHNPTILHLDNQMNLYRILFFHRITIYIWVLWVVLKLKTKLTLMINCCLHLYTSILVTFHVVANMKVHTNWFWVVLKPSRRTISTRALHYQFFNLI